MPERSRLGVIGWPVSHSRSPQMQNAALRAVGLHEWRYQLLPVPEQLLESTVRALEAAGFRGANVTIPHKQAALKLADETSEEALAIGAANTLLFDDGSVRAENTDAPGLIDSLPFSPQGKTALVLGAGGSARAAVWALIAAGAAEVRVWNRTAQRAHELSAQLGASVASAIEPADILVNCTPVGMDRHSRLLKSIPQKADEIAMFRCVVDFVYDEGQTRLVSAAHEAGVPAVDGFDLLVAQGALSFERFTGRAAPREVMRTAAGLND